MRETAFAHYRELLESMARLDIRLLCCNFMAGPGWSRTGVRPVRGGALATYFSKAEYDRAYVPVVPSARPLRLTKAQGRTGSPRTRRARDSRTRLRSGMSTTTSAA